MSFCTANNSSIGVVSFYSVLDHGWHCIRSLRPFVHHYIKAKRKTSHCPLHGRFHRSTVARVRTAGRNVAKANALRFDWTHKVAVYWCKCFVYAMVAVYSFFRYTLHDCFLLWILQALSTFSSTSEFLAACIVPLPFLIYCSYKEKRKRRGAKSTYVTIDNRDVLEILHCPFRDPHNEDKVCWLVEGLFSLLSKRS